MYQAATTFKIGSRLKVELDRVRERIPSRLQEQIKADPRGTLVKFKMTDGQGIGVVLELSNGSTCWFFENEISRA